MAQPNANREPTMEEILASIRRIIESNDTAGENKPALVTAMSDDEDALEDDIAPPVQVSQAFMPRQAAGFELSNEGARPSGRPVSLADVAARVRASGTAAAAVSTLSAPLLRTTGNAAVRIEPEMDFAETAFADEADDDAEGFSSDIRADNDAGEADEGSQEAAFDSDIRQAIDAAMATESELETVSELETESELEPEAVSDAPAVAEPMSTNEESGRQLVSSTTGAKVAAAFEDLSAAFKAEQRRSFDEMAEEMLLPMLQRWLDDNLPTLVERLVREEIERVSRGSRR